MAIKKSDLRKLIHALQHKGRIGGGASNPYEQIKDLLDTSDIDYCKRVVDAALEQGLVVVEGPQHQPVSIRLATAADCSENSQENRRRHVCLALNRLRREQAGELVELDCRPAGWEQLAEALGFKAELGKVVEVCVQEAVTTGHLEFEWDYSVWPHRAVLLFDERPLQQAVA